MHLWNLEAPLPPHLLVKFLLGKGYSYAYFRTGNTIIADFLMYLAVVIDSNFGSTGGIYWT